jgi:hypothetical protein
MYILRSYVGGVVDIRKEIKVDSAAEARKVIRKFFRAAKVKFARDIVYVEGIYGEKLKLFYRAGTY